MEAKRLMSVNLLVILFCISLIIRKKLTKQHVSDILLFFFVVVYFPKCGTFALPLILILVCMKVCECKKKLNYLKLQHIYDVLYCIHVLYPVLI